jgi:hypothetical protein
MTNFYKAPVQGVIELITDGLSSTIKDVSKFISDAITPLIATSEPVFDFWLRIAGFSLIIGHGQGRRYCSET